jgi:hypothetical protein
MMGIAGGIIDLFASVGVARIALSFIFFSASACELMTSHLHRRMEVS